MGDTTTAVVCVCDVDGELPPLALPRIASRALASTWPPIDVCDEAAVRWLLACVWPDEADRCARVRAAIALAREDPPRVVRGDALALLPKLVGGDGGSGATSAGGTGGTGDAAAESSGGEHPVVWHSWVLAYWSAAAAASARHGDRRLGARRDLTWLYLEQPVETPGLPTPACRTCTTIPTTRRSSP